MLKRHPSYATLNRFADSELGPRRRRRVANHLAACDRCRKDVTFIRQAGEVARSLAKPPLPDGLLERVLERRAAGERVILPLESPGAVQGRGPKAAPVVAAVLTLFAVGLFVSTGLLQADRPDFRTLPERPRAGQPLTVEYDGGYEFSDLDQLSLRTRFVTGSGRSWQQLGGILRRGDDGIFRARLQLHDSVVYAAFAVESQDGDRVDHNGGRLWDVMAHGPDGRPTLEALTQRYVDIVARDVPEASRTVESMTGLYPESPRGWWLKAAAAGRGSGDDSTTAFYRDRLRDLERSFAESPPSDPDDFAFLALFAGTMGELADLQHWTAEAERRGARSRWLALARTAVVRAYERLPPAQALRELETIWQESPTAVASIAGNAWALALRARDWDAALRWLRRFRESAGYASPSVMLSQLRDAFGPRRALDWAQSHAHDELLRMEAHRRLNRTPQESERALDADRQQILATMASMAMATGRPELAEDLALQGLTVAWQTEALASIGGVLLEVGDTANAAAAFARVAADPAAPPIPAAITARPGWTERLETARYALIRHVLEGSVVRYLPTEVAPDSGPRVIAFLSFCGAEALAVRDLPAEIVTVYATSVVDSVRARLNECGLKVPVKPDPDGRIADAFGLKAFESLFVTGAAGRLRFSHSMPEDLPRELMALRGEESSVAD